jgi:hypothetical protein
MKKFILNVLLITLIGGAICSLSIYSYFYIVDNSVTKKNIIGFKDLKLQDIVTDDNIKTYHNDFRRSHRDFTRTFNPKIPNVKAVSYAHGFNESIDKIVVTFSYENKDLCSIALKDFREKTFNYYGVDKSYILLKNITDKNKRTINIENFCSNKLNISYIAHDFSVTYSSYEENKIMKDIEQEQESILNRAIEKSNSEEFLNGMYSSKDGDK